MRGCIKDTAHACGISTRLSYIALIEIAGQLSEDLSSWFAMEKGNFLKQWRSCHKKPRLPLYLKKTHQRFGESVSGNLGWLTTPVIPDNTKKIPPEPCATSGNRYPQGICRQDLDSPPWNVHELNHWPARSTSIMQALTRLVLRISRSIVTLKMTNKHGLLCISYC